MCYVLLEDDHFVTSDDIIAAFQIRYPELKLNDIAPGVPQGSAMVFSIGNIPVSVMQLPFPVPMDSFTSAFAANRSWKDAESAVARHKAHLVVSVMDSVDEFDDAKAAARCLTVLAGILVRLTQTAGVYWAPGDVISSAEAFMLAEEKAFVDEPPVEEWIQFLFYGAPRDTSGRPTLAATTNGLRAFIGRELDLQPLALPPLEVAKLIYGPAWLILKQGPVIKDGDTIKGDGAELEARYFARGFREHIPVIRLQPSDGAHKKQNAVNHGEI
jgi:hypothetical protein